LNELSPENPLNALKTNADLDLAPQDGKRLSKSEDRRSIQLSDRNIRISHRTGRFAAQSQAFNSRWLPTPLISRLRL
jgi:hypothetical protein